jgi:hypothetical protein
VVGNPAPEERRERLEDFVRYRQESLRGDEKGEAQVFLDRLFKALGHDGVFEAGATLEERVPRRDAGGTAFADLVWKPRVLIEMKKAGVDLARHYRQAFEYWMYLVPDRPHYMVLCNFDELWIYDLNEQLDDPVDRLELDDLPHRWEAVAFMLPVEERPTFQNDLVAVTRESAALVSAVFNALVERGVDRDSAQRFVLQAVMAMFAEDIGLLPRHHFAQAVEDSLAGDSAYDLIFGLFEAMNAEGPTPAGRYQGTPYFNGGLFREIPRFELAREELAQLKDAAEPDWSQVRPAIFGTLFEQSMEAEERHAFGAHFTSEADIQKVVLPSIVRPWRERIEEATTLEELGRVENDLLNYRVLDPACGCGNFLYVAYRELRRLERQVQDKVRDRRRREGAEAEMQLAFVSTKQFHGLDINAFAVEVAKVTMMLARKLAADELGDERSVLPLDDLDENIKAEDAVFVDWPEFDACIGNPPYLGQRRIIEERGAAYANRLKNAYPEVGGVADYVSYWFRKAHDLLPDDGYAGLVGTNTIRQGDTRKVSLDYLVDNGGVIYDAVSSQPWSGDATVEVSIVNWTKGQAPTPLTLWLAEGTVKLEVEEITGALSADIDLRRAKNLAINRQPKSSFQGQTPGVTDGYVLSVEDAAALVARDATAAGVIHPYLIGEELKEDGQPARFIIDIPSDDAVEARALGGAAFDHLRQHVLPVREEQVERERRDKEEILADDPDARVTWPRRDFMDHWWKLWRRRAGMVQAIEGLGRYIALSRVAVEGRPSIYMFMAPNIRPGDAVQAFAFEDDYSFGILQSSIHRLWFEKRCSTMRVDLRYTPTTVYNSFPWPQAPTEHQAETIAAAVGELLRLRDEWLAEGMSLEAQYATLRDPGRNALADAHKALDTAVLAAYGFRHDEDLLTQLLALNESIATEEAEGTTQPRSPGPHGLGNVKQTETRVEAQILKSLS